MILEHTANKKSFEREYQHVDMLKKVKAVTVGVLFVFTLYITALIGAIFLIGPAMPLLFINGRLFRKCADYVAYAWFILPAVSIINRCYHLTVLLYFRLHSIEYHGMFK